MYYTDEEIVMECDVVKTMLAAGNLKEALARFVRLAISDARAWEPQNMPEENKSFGMELCNQLKPIYQTLDYPIRLHLLWQRILIDDDLDDVVVKLKQLYTIFPYNEFVLVSIAYCYDKLGLCNTCIYFCNRIKSSCCSSGFYGADTESVDYVMYIIIDSLYELGEYQRVIAVVDGLKEVSEYGISMKILAYRSLRMYDDALDVARNYLRLYDSADVEFFFGHICYLQDKMDCGFDSLCQFVENHYESDYAPFALCYIGRQSEGIELARKRAESKRSGQYILAEILSLTGRLNESYQVLNDYLDSSNSVGKERAALLVDPALQNVLIDGGGLEVVREYMAKCEKHDNAELLECNKSRSGLHGMIQVGYTIQDDYIFIPLRVCSMDTEAIMATACERTIFSLEAFVNAMRPSNPLHLVRSTVKFVHKTRQFGDMTVSEWVVDIVLGDWIIRDFPVLFGDISCNILGADILSQTDSISINNIEHQIIINV